jgi:nucleoside-diphosphate-sugar epimerase
MRVLVTGASGFLGRNFILRAPADWQITAVYRNDAGFLDFLDGLERPTVVPVRCDLADHLQVAQLFEAHGRHWESCLYLAAKVDIPWSVCQPQQDLLLNAGPLLNLLEGISAERFVYFSSGAVYDGLSGEVDPSAPIAPTLPYAISKLACERYVEFYRQRKQSIRESLIVRFFGAYGPYEAPHKIYTRVIREVGIGGKDFYRIYGAGKNLIDALYVDDAVDAIQRIITGNHWNDTINLAGGCPVTIESLVREIGIALRPGGVRIEKEGVAHESNNFWGSMREMREWFGFEPKVSLAEGVSRFRRFLEAHDRDNTAAAKQLRQG